MFFFHKAPVIWFDLSPPMVTVHFYLPKELSGLWGSSAVSRRQCVSVTSGTPVRPVHMRPCQRRLCLLCGARATQLLVIGCVGSIMTLGGGRRQQSMKQNTALCASLGTLWFLRSPLSALTPQRCQRVSKVEAMWYRSVLLLSVPEWDATHCIIYLRGSYCTFSEITVPKSEAYKNLITSFITVVAIISKRWRRGAV